MTGTNGNRGGGTSYKDYIVGEKQWQHRGRKHRLHRLKVLGLGDGVWPRVMSMA